MYQPHLRKRNHGLLWALVAAGTLYAAWPYLGRALPGDARLDGSVGVLLGLFACSRPAANLLDVVLPGGSSLLAAHSRRANFWWLALNVLVALVGFCMIVAGATRFATPVGIPGNGPPPA